VHDARLHLAGDRRRAARARRILPQRVNAALQKAAAPQCDLASVQTDLHGDVLVLQALRSQQDDLCALAKPRLDAAPLRQDAKLPLRLSIQIDRLGNSHRPALLREVSSMLATISSTISGALH
jgi:hypothetical protein